jgi:serine/threonine-protein kinase RsbW
MGDGGSAVRMRLLAVPAAASLVRERLRGWLGALGWGEADLDDVVLAVHEAVTNSIEHGYAGAEPGEVEVVGARLVEGAVQRARFTVRDDGRWRPPRDPGYRGRGVTVMRGCMAEVTIRPGDGGTEVEMVSRPVPVHRSRTPAPMTVASPEVRSVVDRSLP